MNNRFNLLESAANKAMGRVSKILGDSSVDPNVKLYEQLKPEMFTEIARQFGEENTIQYIKEMEALRLTGGQQ